MVRVISNPENQAEWLVVVDDVVRYRGELWDSVHFARRFGF